MSISLLFTLCTGRVWIAAGSQAEVYSPLHDGCSKLKWNVGELAVMDGAYKLQKEEDCSLLL